MYREEIAINHLNIMVNNYKNSDFKGKTEKEINERADFIKEQIDFVQQLDLVNIITMNEYLSQVEKKRVEELKKLSRREYREQVVNFNDDVLTAREKYILAQKEEQKALNKNKGIDDDTLSVSEWLYQIENDVSSSSSANNEREAMNRNKEQEKMIRIGI